MPDLRLWLARLGGTAAALAVVAGVALATRVEIGTPPSGSELRLALRAAGARLEVCRDRTAEELARLPAHLRTRQDCDELAIDYRLTVEVDGDRRLERVVSHRGVRHTRPLALGESVAVPPGSHRVRIAFEPVRPAELGDAAAPEAATAAGRWLDAFRALPAPALEEDLDFQAGRALLVELADDGSLRLAR